MRRTAWFAVLLYGGTLTVEAFWLWHMPHKCLWIPVVALVRCAVSTYGIWMLVPGFGLMLLVFVVTTSSPPAQKETIRQNAILAALGWYLVVVSCWLVIAGL